MSSGFGHAAMCPGQRTSIDGGIDHAGQNRVGAYSTTFQIGGEGIDHSGCLLQRVEFFVLVIALRCRPRAKRLSP